MAQLVATTYHVGVDEAELLPAFRRDSESDERVDLGERFERAKARAAAA